MEIGTMGSRQDPFMPRWHATSPFIMEKQKVPDRDHDRLK